jgi:pilus assembly protein CpaC
VSIEWKNYGTRVDFIPFVLGNGRIRLDVRPTVSEVDNTRSAVAGVPAIKLRETDTCVEVDVGQTLAIAGLVQTRVEAQNRGLPWISDVPYLGAAFRRVREENNEIETLILVTPEIVDGMDPHEVPPCPPGTTTRSPGDWQLYMLGKLEVPNTCPSEEAAADGDSERLRGGQVPSQAQPDTTPPPKDTDRPPPAPKPSSETQPREKAGVSSSQKASAPALPASRPVNRQDRPSLSGPSATAGEESKSGGLPGFLGPIGYDMGK